MLRKAFASSFLASCFSLAILVQAAAAPSTYTVVSGDTLSDIAQRFHTSVAQIVRYNHLSDANALSLGEVLRLAPLAPLRSHHTVALRKRKPVLASKSTHHRTVAVHRSVRHTVVVADIPARNAELQGLWIATHAGSAPPSFAKSLATAQRLVAVELQLTRTALRYLGVPYAWGGESFSGVDCSGFVQVVFRHNGIELPRTADAQFEVGRHVTMNRLQPGDLVFFQTYAEGASHVGIYLGDGRFVHASASDGVRVDSLSEDYYSTRYIGARRTI